MSAEAMTQAENLLNLHDVAKANGDLSFKITVGLQIEDFRAANGGSLEPWMNDQLDAASADLLGNQAGTSTNPNAYTTGAARKQDDSILHQLGGKAFGDDLKQGLIDAFKGLGEGALKGSGSTLIKVGALLGVGYFLFKYAQKKGVL